MPSDSESSPPRAVRPTPPPELPPRQPTVELSKFEPFPELEPFPFKPDLRRRNCPECPSASRENSCAESRAKAIWKAPKLRPDGSRPEATRTTLPVTRKFSRNWRRKNGRSGLFLKSRRHQRNSKFRRKWKDLNGPKFCHLNRFCQSKKQWPSRKKSFWRFRALGLKHLVRIRRRKNWRWRNLGFPKDWKRIARRCRECSTAPLHR